MERMTYEDRINQITEELCRQEIDRKFGDGVWKSKDITLSNRKAMYKHYSLAARITITKMAEAATEFLGSLSEYGVQKRLSEYGLIPDKTEAK